MATPMIRPSQIDSLPYLDADKKSRYKNALQQLWNTYEQAIPGSPQHAEFEGKLRAASQKIMSELSSKSGSSARPVSGSGPQQRMPQQGGQMGGQVQQQQGGGMPTQVQAPVQAGAGQGGQGGQGQGGQAGGQQNAYSPAVREMLSKIQVNIPPNIPPAQAGAYRNKFFKGAAENLTKREQAVVMGRAAQSRQQSLQAQQQEVPQQLLASLENARKVMAECEIRHKNLLAQNDSYRQTNQQAAQLQQGQGPPSANGVQAQDMQRTTSNTAQNAPIKQEQRMSMSPPQPQGSFAQQAQGVNANAPAVNSQSQQHNMAQQPPQQQQQQAHQTPQTATQPQPPQNFPQNAQQHYQPQPQQPQRPPMNTQLSQTQLPHQHQNTPTSAIPQSATQQQQTQGPQPLTQQDAMKAATDAYRRQQHMAPQPHPGQQQQQRQEQQIPNGLPFNQPASATQTTPNSAFPQQQHQQQQQQQPPPSAGGHLQTTAQTPNNKFPIKPTMQLNPQLTAPVPGPPSRPTMASQTMAQQPGLTRPQPFTLEGEGDRVLSKRKLDELVRQVTGSTNTSTDPTNADANSALSPEVETSILQLADDFVDNVLTSACRLAKLRPSATLDLRDVQLVLERNYGIRVPGYALDEVRTVRKFQPAAGWQSKMQAVQTAKTLGGVGKGDA